MHGFHLFQLRSIGLLNLRFSLRSWDFFVGCRLVGVGLGSHTPKMIRENEGETGKKGPQGPQKRKVEKVCFATFLPIFRWGKITDSVFSGAFVLL